MELIDRYLQAVKSALPKAQRDDIIRKLRDSILSQVEDKEAALGRPLNEEEQVELLKKLGRPSHLAGRYRGRQYLIGPGLFSIYWQVLRLSLFIVFLIHVGAAVVIAAVGGSFGMSLRALAQFPNVALLTFAWMTLAFVGLDFAGGKYHLKDNWDPRKLPRLVKDDSGKSRVDLFARLAAQAIFGAWWLAGLRNQWLLLGPGAAFLKFGQVWMSIYLLFVAAVLANMVLTATMLAWPGWKQGEQVYILVKSAIALVILFFLVNSPDLFLPANSGAAHLQALVKPINFGLHIALVIAAIVNVCQIPWQIAKMMGWKAERLHLATLP